MAEESQWNKTRASVIPITYIIAFFYLFGMLNNLGEDDPGSSLTYFWIGIVAAIIGLPISFYIYFYTKNTLPPRIILDIYAFLAFGSSIAWINWTSNCVVDLLKLFGFITKLPQALLSLTFLAWGNSLGDMSADTAMTRKGFGEMAITATMAGPIFNILIG